MPEESLPDLVNAYGALDAKSQGEVLERVESILYPMLRPLIGVQIRSEGDSLDVCQALLLAFHLRAREGKVEVPNETALRAYLRTMIRHKLANISDHIKAEKRGGGQAPVRIDADLQLPSVDLSASTTARTTDLRRQLETILTEDELSIFEGRLAGRTYGEIAEEQGRNADAVRMAWKRAQEKLAARGLGPA